MSDVCVNFEGDVITCVTGCYIQVEIEIHLLTVESVCIFIMSVEDNELEYDSDLYIFNHNPLVVHDLSLSFRLAISSLLWSLPHHHQQPPPTHTSQARRDNFY